MVKSETPGPLFENPRPRLESFNKIRARVSVPRKPSPRLHFAGFQNCWQRDMTMSYTIFNKYKIDKSRVPKCYTMTTNLRHKNPTCRAYIFKRLLSCVFNQINNFIMVLIETIDQKKENPRPRSQKFENPRRKETQENEISRLFQNAFEIGTKISETLNFPDTIRHPLYSGCAIIFENKIGIPVTPYKEHIIDGSESPNTS